MIGIDTHFIRFLHLAIFEDRPHRLAKSVWLDCFLILFGVIPAFVIGLRFWTAPSYLKYSLKINSLVAPFTLLIIFCANHVDVVCMGGTVLLMNIYVFWYHVDPPLMEYSTDR